MMVSPLFRASKPMTRERHTPRNAPSFRGLFHFPDINHGEGHCRPALARLVACLCGKDRCSWSKAVSAAKMFVIEESFSKQKNTIHSWAWNISAGGNRAFPHSLTNLLDSAAVSATFAIRNTTRPTNFYSTATYPGLQHAYTKIRSYFPIKYWNSECEVTHDWRNIGSSKYTGVIRCSK